MVCADERGVIEAQTPRNVFAAKPSRWRDKPRERGPLTGGDDACKMWIAEVVPERTLSICGEVAERLKAAVC